MPLGKVQRERAAAREAQARSTETCVYDIVLNGEVVYVGMTGNPKRRYFGHVSSGIIRDGAELVVHKWYATREVAKVEERRRQFDIKPVYCRQSFVYDPDGFALLRCVVDGAPDEYRLISKRDPDRFERMEEQYHLCQTGKEVYTKPWRP